MAFARVQGKTGRSGSLAGTVGITFNSTPTVGNLVIVQTAGFVTSGTVSFAVSDNKGNTYSQAILSDQNDRVRTAIFYAYNIASSATFTVTVTAASATIEAAVTEWSGFGANNPVDRSTKNTGTSSTPSSGTTSAPHELNAVVTSCCGIGNSASLLSIAVDSVSPAWTQEMERLNSPSPQGEMDSRIITNGAAQSCGWTINSSQNYTACIAVFVEAAPHPPIRATQVVQTVVGDAAPTPVRLTQIVQTVAASPTIAQLRVTQVVQTLVVLAPTTAEPITLFKVKRWGLERFDMKVRSEDSA